MNSHDFLKRLDIRLPIFLAPMAAVGTPELAAAVAAAGGLGALGCADMTPQRVEAAVVAIRGRTDGPINLNFFVNPPADLRSYDSRPMRARLAPYYAELGLGDVPEPAPPYGPFDDAMLRTVLALRPRVASFHFGLPAADAVAALRASGIMVIASATTREEAQILERGGVDAVIAQGWEAGGHRGTFAPGPTPSIGTMALTREIAAGIRLPVIAAGGIADGSGIAAACALGAAAAQIGTAFLACPESGLNPVYRRILAAPHTTQVTRIFSGRPARVIVNRFVREMADMEDAAAPFPAQHGLTTPLRKPSAERNSGDFLPMYAGQAASLARVMPAGELMALLASEMKTA